MPRYRTTGQYCHGEAWLHKYVLEPAVRIAWVLVIPRSVLQMISASRLHPFGAPTDGLKYTVATLVLIQRCMVSWLALTDRGFRIGSGRCLLAGSSSTITLACMAMYSLSHPLRLSPCLRVRAETDGRTDALLPAAKKRRAGASMWLLTAQSTGLLPPYARPRRPLSIPHKGSRFQ